jgi:CRP/FNR family transcriptional regulator, anaerobic regulatory protein
MVRSDSQTRIRHELLFSYLSSITPISENLKRAIESELTFMVVPKNYFLLQTPSIANEVHFLYSGFAVSYVMMGQRKVTKGFWKPGQFIVSFKSFFSQTPSQQILQTVEKSELLTLTLSSLNKILNGFPEAQLLYQKMMYKHCLLSMRRVDEFQSLHAGARFEKLIRQYPRLEKHVTQESIASYLGITPQSLSRLKRHA